ncbi:MAG: histidine--tRNA ligase [Thermofilum sp.]
MGDILKTPRGTRDWLPEEAAVKRMVEERIRAVFELYGYGEVCTPAFEYLELLVAKAGEEVVKQIYNFKDKGGRELGLRFELTTPIARIVASRPDLPKPIRFYYISPVWRYEEPQRGRLREFWQAGIELIGVEGPEGDAEVIAVAYEALRSAGLANFEVRLNDREVVEDLVTSAGIHENRVPEALRVLDKLERFGEEYVVKELEKLGASTEAARKLVERLKDGIEDFEPKSEKGKKGLKRLQEILDLLKSAYHVDAQIDLAIVRGLGYYTSTVFEVKTPLVEVGSVAGGGRYDDLISSLGGPRLPATGMAIGIERVLEVLKASGSVQTRKTTEVHVLPIAGDKNVLAYALQAAGELRRLGVRTIVEYSQRSLSKMLEKALKAGARFAVIVGPSEISSNVVTIRDLEAREEFKLPIDRAASFIKSRMESVQA